MTRAEREYLESVAELGCIVCRNLKFYDTPAEIHHIRDGQGLAQRASNFESIGLCHIHHRTGGYGIAIHAGKKEFEKKFGTERELLEQVHNEIGYKAAIC